MLLLQRLNLRQGKGILEEEREGESKEKKYR